MTERFILAAACDAPGLEETAATRDRLRDAFPRGATRRMTQLGLLVGAVLRDIALETDDALVYASTFAENQALAGYLASFPTPSPTLFQTSIHPSAVQQVLIARQQPVREVFPLTGQSGLGGRALAQAALTPGRRVIVCGGEERGSWLRERGLASEESFAFALVLSGEPAGATGRVRWRGAPGATTEGWSLRELTGAIASRRSEARGGAELAWE